MLWELGQTLLPAFQFHKAHGGNFVVSFLVEVVDFITMWFYFHCTRCCCPPLTLCALLPWLWALNLPHWSVLGWCVSMQRQQTNHPSPSCSVPCPGNSCLSNPSVSPCAKTGTFWWVGSLNPWFVLALREMSLTLVFKQAFKMPCFLISEHAELSISTWFPGGESNSQQWTQRCCAHPRCNQCVFSLADSPADTVFVYSQRTHEEDFRDTHVCHWG